MSIDQKDVIDFVFPGDRDGNTSLIISDHLPWDADEAEHWYMLQEKVNCYLPFIMDGRLRKDFPASSGMVAEDIKRGQLVTVLDGISGAEMPISILWARTLALRAEIRVVVDEIVGNAHRFAGFAPEY